MLFFIWIFVLTENMPFRGEKYGAMGTGSLYDVAFTLMQGHDVVMTLHQC